MRSRIVVPALAGLAVLTVGLTGADAKRVTFEGECDMKGTVTFSPGLKPNNTQQKQDVNFRGTCTGGPSTLTGSVTGSAGCTGAAGPANGTGVLTVAGKRIPVNMTLDAKLPNGNLQIKGKRAGIGSGSVAFLTGGNLGKMGDCLGKGLQEVGASTIIRTSEKLVSGKKKKKKKKKKRG